MTRPRPKRPRRPPPKSRTSAGELIEDVRLRLDIAYDGTDFAGWAAQTGQRTVAGVLDEALTTVFRTPVRLHAAGRTDTGVHARGRWPTSTSRPTRCRMPTRVHRAPAIRNFCRCCAALPGFCPPMCGSSKIARAPAGFDSRFSALRRHYLYRLSTAPYGVRAAARRATSPPGRGSGRGRDERRVARPGGPARLRRVLPPPRWCHHHPRPAAARLVARGRSDHRARHRRRVLLVDGAVTGRGVAGRRRAAPPGHVVS